MEEVNAGASWNKKRIFITVFLGAILITSVFLLKNKILDKNISLNPDNEKKVQGVSTQEENDERELGVRVQEAVMEKVNSIKQQASGLNITEIASSSPQVQKIINDIKSLEQYPINQAQEICKKICGLPSTY